MVAAAALTLAWMLDRWFGEPRSSWHPVAWFGLLAAPLGRRVRGWRPGPAFVAGAMLWCVLVSLAVGAALAVQTVIADAPLWLAIPVLGLALKPSFAWRMLKDEVRAVETALAEGLELGRTRVSYLCSRDVTQLGEAAVRETAIETLAENFNDSLVAPLFWFAVAGLPGAWAWRAANTLDAMWGYRGDWEWAGKWAARADDVLGWVPARLSALLLWQPGMSVARLRREAACTPSPNGGWPMAAMALHIDARLGKPGVYTLNVAAPEPDAAAMERALKIAERAAWAAIGSTMFLLGLREWVA